MNNSFKTSTLGLVAGLTAGMVFGAALLVHAGTLEPSPAEAVAVPGPVSLPLELTQR